MSHCSLEEAVAEIMRMRGWSEAKAKRELLSALASGKVKMRCCKTEVRIPPKLLENIVDIDWSGSRMSFEFSEAESGTG